MRKPEDWSEQIKSALYVRRSGYDDAEVVWDEGQPEQIITAIQNDAVALPEWQPIDTAPREGQWILVCESPKGHMAVAQWIISTAHWSIGASCSFRNPTHWMPLPDMPT